MPPEMQLPKQNKKKPVALIVAALVIVVVFAAMLVFSVMKKNPLKETLLPEPSASSLQNGNTNGGVMNVGVTVDRIDVMMQESFPVQVRALVRGNLADGCTTITNASSRKDGNTFFVDFETLHQGEVCTQAVVPFEQLVTLDVMGLKKGTYTISAAGFTTSFTLGQDNVLDFSSDKK